MNRTFIANAIGSWNKASCVARFHSASCLKVSDSSRNVDSSSIAVTPVDKPSYVNSRLSPVFEPPATVPNAASYYFPDNIDLGPMSGVPEEHISGRRARIFIPARAATQAGLNNTKLWSIELDEQERWESPLIGWCSNGDPISNISMALEFASKEDAIRFCERKGWEYEVEEPQVQKIKPKTYGSNFSWSKKTRVSTK